MSGYASPEYASSLSEFGQPLPLERSGGWLLGREIPGTADRDAMGCYPLFSCRDWNGLESDLDALTGRLVSVCLVADPFGAHDPALLERTFRDLVCPYKRHFVVDMRRDPLAIPNKHHRYYARRALREVDVRLEEDPISQLDTWIELYQTLSARHDVAGVRAFSRLAFATQLRTPGIVMLSAVHHGVTVGAHLWYVMGDVAVSHLAASSRRGYELGASYALYWRALESFEGRVRWMNLGGGAGTRDRQADGLARFKRGWSNATRTAHLCGRVLDPPRYRAHGAARGGSESEYFPIYRTAEFR